MFDSKDMKMEKKVIDNIRLLGVDMIDKAQSGHPGIVLGAAPIIYTLYSRFLKIDPKYPNWLVRDRFVLSAGHGSALLYSMLYFIGYLELDDLKEFRQYKSKTPGHPEIETMGVDSSTGPLGQGFANAVGMAIAERYLASYFNPELIDYYTYSLVGDGDLEEGITMEAASIAGHLGLNKLIVLYDSNDITLDGSLYNSYSDNTELKFKSMNWNYILVKDGENIDEISRAIESAKTSDKPTLIEVKTVIGRFSEKQATHQVHGAPLEKEDISQIKEKLGLRDNPFNVSQDALDYFRENFFERTENLYKNWEESFNKLSDDEKEKLNLLVSKDPINLNIEIEGESEATRVSSSKVLNEIAKINPFLIGGAADLSSSTKTYIKDDDYMEKDNYKNRNIAYGIREHAMGGITNGLALSNLIPFASTFLSFSDYMKASIRMSALMNQFVIYIFTHDSISVGEDGPTHQAVEQLTGLRAIPNVDLYRPADLNEVIGAYNSIFKRRKPSILVCSRNKSNLKKETKIKDVEKGAYILKKERGKLEGIIISSGEELDLALDIKNSLDSKGYSVRLVSMPSINLFKEQDLKYQEKILDKNVKTFVIALEKKDSFYQFVNDDKCLFTVNEFGLSAKKDDILEHFNLIHDKIESEIEKILNEEKV